MHTISTVDASLRAISTVDEPLHAISTVDEPLHSISTVDASLRAIDCNSMEGDVVNLHLSGRVIRIFVSNKLVVISTFS